MTQTTGDAIDGEFERRLRDVIDKQELHELVARLHRGLDEVDADAICSAFAPGFRYGSRVGMTPGDFAAHVRRMHRVSFEPGGLKLRSTQHAITNELYEVDGDVASGECYATFRGVTTDGVLVQMFHRYVDRYVRAESGWLLAERDVHIEWTSPELDAYAAQVPRPQ